MKSINGKLAVIDGNKVFWNGQEVPFISMTLHCESDGAKMVRIEVQGGDETILQSMEADGIRVRRVK